MSETQEVEFISAPKLVLEEAAQNDKHRMPEHLKKFLMFLQGKPYLMVAYRLVWFRDANPLWSIKTELLQGGHLEGFAVCKADIYDEKGNHICSGIGSEEKKDFPQGWIEKAETKAVGRALGMAGYGTQFTGEIDEVSQDVSRTPVKGTQRPVDSPVATGAGVEAQRSGNAQTGAQDAQVGRPGIYNGPEEKCPGCNAPKGRRHASQPSPGKVCG